MWTELIENEAHELNELSVIIKLMESPFGFIQGFQLDKKLLHTKIKTKPINLILSDSWQELDQSFFENIRNYIAKKYNLIQSKNNF